MLLLGITFWLVGGAALAIAIGRGIKLGEKFASPITVTVMPPTKDEQILLDMEWQLLLMGDGS
jgi:hypothetical protein